MTFVQQMNAATGSWERLEDGEYADYWVEDKYDGERWTAWIDQDRKVHVYSRHTSKETGTNVVKSENVPHLVSVLSLLPPDTIVDGEIVFIKDGKISFKGVREIMGCKLPGKAWVRQLERGCVTYMLFDCIRYGGICYLDQELAIRRAQLELAVRRLHDKSYANMQYVQVVPTYDICEAHDRFAEAVANKQEGIMIKNRYSKYVSGDRPSKTWLKLKVTDTFDAVIMGFEDGAEWYAEPGTIGRDGVLYPDGRKTKYKQNGWFGSIIYGQYVRDLDGNYELKRMGKASGCNEEMRKLMSESPDDYIGRAAEFTAMARSSTGTSRHPAFKRMRDDKNAIDCKFDPLAVQGNWS